MGQPIRLRDRDSQAPRAEALRTLHGAAEAWAARVSLPPVTVTEI